MGFLFLIIPVLIPIILTLINKRFFSNKYESNTIAFLSAFILYLFLFITITLINYQIEMELYAHDLDKDGSFSDEECTPECSEAMLRFTSDTGRNFGLVLGPIFCMFYFVILQIVFWILKWIKSKYNKSNYSGSENN
jgi:ABC-type amino acid transport system permease subunit